MVRDGAAGAGNGRRVPRSLLATGAAEEPEAERDDEDG